MAKMLNTIIKHIIYETCISVLFEKIQCNFAQVAPEEFKIRMIKVNLGDMTFRVMRPLAIPKPWRLIRNHLGVTTGEFQW